MQTNSLQPERSADLLGCPFCGGTPKVTELRYINTGRLYGYWLKCGGCGLEIKEQPGCWPAGKENEEMLEAKEALVMRWNRRQLGGSAGKPKARSASDILYVLEKFHHCMSTMGAYHCCAFCAETLPKHKPDCQWLKAVTLVRQMQNADLKNSKI